MSGKAPTIGHRKNKSRSSKSSQRSIQAVCERLCEGSHNSSSSRSSDSSNSSAIATVVIEVVLALVRAVVCRKHQFHAARVPSQKSEVSDFSILSVGPAHSGCQIRTVNVQLLQTAPQLNILLSIYIREVEHLPKVKISTATLLIESVAAAVCLNQNKFQKLDDLQKVDLLYISEENP